MNKTLDKIALFIAQGAYSGRFPLAPGTAGTVVGVLLYVLLKDLGQLWYCAIFTAVFAVGNWAADRAEDILGQKDSPSIVIDEIAGFLVAMFLVPFSWRTVAAGFILFRVFDIAKPWPLRRVQDIPGGAGIMLDDLGAGLYANVVLQVVLQVSGS
jgi:phosphatidylglycerophosphatase A